MPLFSIVIPLYNSEKYIKKCLLSVLKQKFYNYEILIINDCSTDNSLKICKKFEKKYSFIKILNQKKNKGVSFCRNLGIQSSTGEYIIFLDSDDYLLNTSLNKLSKFIEQDRKAEIIIGQHNASSDGNIYSKHIDKEHINNEDKIKFINQIPYFTGYCWRFVVKRRFLANNKIFFIKAHQYEDEDFVCKLIIYSKFISFFKEKFYFYRTLPMSLGTTINFNTARSCVVILESLLQLYKSKNISLQKQRYCKSRIDIILRHLYPLLFLIPTNSLAILSQYIFKNMNIFLLLKKIKPKNGLGIVLFKKKVNFLLNCKKIIAKNTLTKINKLKIENFYLFCMDKYGFAVAKILLSYNFKIKGFLDNNYNCKNKSKFSIKFIPAKYGIKEIKSDKSYIIICNQRKEHIISISSQLVNGGISKEKILIKTFALNLDEKVKKWRDGRAV